MKRFVLRLCTILPLAAPLAAAEPLFLGEPNCLVAQVLPAPKAGAVRWKGACLDGHADGAGVLRHSPRARAGSSSLLLNKTLLKKTTRRWRMATNRPTR